MFVTMIMIILVVCMISVNASAVYIIGMGRKEEPLAGFKMASYLYYGGNMSNSITFYYMETEVDNRNGIAGDVNFLDYKVDYGIGQSNTNLQGNIHVEMLSDQGFFNPIEMGDTGTFIAPVIEGDTLGSFAKGAAAEIAVGIGDSQYWQFTRTTFPLGSTTYYNS